MVMTRPTLLLQNNTRVFVKGIWGKGTVLAHSAKTGRYMVQMDTYRFLHQRFIYRERGELIQVGGD